MNSSFNELEETEKAKKAQEIALFARKHFASIEMVDTILVSFVIHKTYFFVFQYNNVLASYLFDKSHITDGNLLNRPAKEVVKATSSYSEPQNKTTVLVNHLQLHGNVKNGLILIPSFTVSGNKVVVPKWVDLEFTSYADRETFAENRGVAIYVDSMRVDSGNARFLSSGKQPDGTFAEFLTHRVTYKQFLQVINGQEVELKLGTKNIKLRAEHLESLRDMKKCIDNSGCQ